MKQLLTSLALLALVPVGGALADTPDDILFDVYRNGSPFGEHTVRFQETENGALQVDVDVELRAGLGPISLFRYRHDSREVWDDGELVSVTADTFNDGTEMDFSLEGDAIPPLTLSSHWRGYQAGLDRVFNTETGEPMDVVIEDLGEEMFDTPDGPVPARHLRIIGTLTADLWYDENGRWIGCAFEARGQEIRYVLRDS